MADPKNYLFDTRLGTTGRWRLKGRIVSEASVLADVERVTLGYKNNMQSLSQSLINETISLADWQAGMADNIRQVNNIQGAIAKGGWRNMTQSDWGHQGQLIKRQRAFLQKFALDIESGKQKLNGNFMRRAGMYADAGRRTAGEVKRPVAKKNGFTEERRVIFPGDSCATCIEEAKKGWQPIGTLRAIGDTICKTNDRCIFEFR